MTSSAVNQADLFTWNSQTSVVDDNDYIRNKACEVLGPSYKASNSSTSTTELALSNNQSLLAVTTAEIDDHRSLSRRSTPANLNGQQQPSTSTNISSSSLIARASQSTNQQQQQRFNVNYSSSSTVANSNQGAISSRHNISSSSSSITPPPTGSSRVNLQAQATSRPSSACLPTAHQHHNHNNTANNKNVSPLSNSATSSTGATSQSSSLSHSSHLSLKTFKPNQTYASTQQQGVKNEPIMSSSKSINKRPKETTPITLEEIFQVKSINLFFTNLCI